MSVIAYYKGLILKFGAYGKFENQFKGNVFPHPCTYIFRMRQIWPTIKILPGMLYLYDNHFMDCILLFIGFSKEGPHIIFTGSPAIVKTRSL
jgi:hypothetical protein